jgi:protein-S-isoprenylcysteine O-methyltransferase Ste14
MTASFWIILLAVLVYGLVHTLLASPQTKAKTRRWLGQGANRWFRLIYNFIASITLLPVLFLPILLVDRELYTIPSPWVLLTAAIQLLAIAALLVGLRQTGVLSFLGLRQLVGPAHPEVSKLVTGGLYRCVRHPLYTAGLVFIWLFPVMTWNLLALNIGLTAYILVGVHFEERKMLQEFGQAYAEYQKKTPMLIPGLRWKRG